MGNLIAPPLKTSPQLSINLSTQNYYPLDILQGTVNLRISNPITCRDIEIEVFCFEAYQYPTNNKLSLKTSLGKIPLDIKKQLKLDKDYVYLKPDSYQFVFSFPLNEFLQPSFEHFSSDSRMTLRYILQAQVIFDEYQAEKEILTEVYFRVFSQFLIPDKKERFLCLKNINQYGLFNQGNCKCYAYLYKSNFHVNDVIPITIKIDNLNCQLTVNLIKITLIRMLNYKKDKNVVNTETQKFNRYKFDVNVKKGKVGIFRYEINLKDTNQLFFENKQFYNLYGNNNDWNMFLTTCKGELIECQYQIKVSFYFKNFVSFKSRPRIIIPIAITHFCTENNTFVEPFDVEEEDIKLNQNDNKGNDINNNIKDNNDKNNNYSENAFKGDYNGNVIEENNDMKKVNPNIVPEQYNLNVNENPNNVINNNNPFQNEINQFNQMNYEIGNNFNNNNNNNMCYNNLQINPNFPNNFNDKSNNNYPIEQNNNYPNLITHENQQNIQLNNNSQNIGFDNFYNNNQFNNINNPQQNNHYKNNPYNINGCENNYLSNNNDQNNILKGFFENYNEGKNDKFNIQTNNNPINFVNNYPSVGDNNYLNNGNNSNQNFITNNYPQYNDDKDITNSFKLL